MVDCGWGYRLLVGLKTVDPSVVLPDGCYAVDGESNSYGHKNMIGRVTSSYFSPTFFLPDQGVA